MKNEGYIEMSEEELQKYLQGEHSDPEDTPEMPIQAPLADQGEAAQVAPQRKLETTPVRPLPAAEHPDDAMNRLERAYMDVTGESMSAETRANMYAFMQRFNIRSHDAIMCLVIANGHLDNRMQKMPHQMALVMEKAARDVLDSCHKASEDEAKKASIKLLQKVAEKIDETQNGGKWRHIGWASPIFILGLLLGNMMTPMAISKWLVSILF